MKKFIPLMLCLFSCGFIFAQTLHKDELVHINNVNSTDDMNTVILPYKGNIVYNKATKVIYQYNGTEWVALGNAWSLFGNSAIVYDNYVGTSDNSDLRFRTNNTERMVIKANGNVGINESNPSELFEVKSGGSNFSIIHSGNVGIGVNPTQSLHVAGNVMASSFATPDYVFQDYFEGKSLKTDYNFQSLEEVEEFAKAHKHLPGVPSADDIAQQGGVVINQATEINLEKIEELFLYSIELKREIQHLKREIQRFKE